MNHSIPVPYDIKSYHYDLPETMIAQVPAEQRDSSRLLALDCATGRISEHAFSDLLDYLKPGDLLVANNTKVFPARLLGKKATGGKVELLILEYPDLEQVENQEDKTGWREVIVTGLLKSSKRPKNGSTLFFCPDLQGIVLESAAAKVRICLRYRGSLADLLEKNGKTPLPPYIRRHEGEQPGDRRRYQTVYAENTGAIAAPTAGLHFTPELLQRIKKRGVDFTAITLHVGYGTFAPVRVKDIREHLIHSEFVTVSAETARLINKTIADGGRLFAVGTTTVRCLEFATTDNGQVMPTQGWCDLYIYPGYKFKLVKNLITNFHLPGSSLLFMVSALAGRKLILECYRHAVNSGYRFFSYGDAMLIMGDNR
jgi:S-adenosylmethionine:tRNA ribosyltransferase-isomerase